MAVKFSQFVVETDKANVNYLVGWDGTENVQITPADLLGSYPSGSGATGQVAFFDSASTLAGDNDLYWDNTNKRLGIGTTSPDYNLHVKKASTGTSITIEGSTNSGANFSSKLNFSNKGISGNDIDFTIGLKKTNNFVFMGDAAANELMRIEGNTGDVGIGTTSPSAKLHVDGTFISTGVSQLGSGGSNVYLTSSSAGSVGIGTSNPSAKLHTKIGTSGGSSYSADVGIFAEGGSRSIIQMSSINDAYLMFGDAAQGNRAWLGYQHSNDQLSLHTSSTITMDGDVGIGTSGPTDKLDIAGAARFTSNITFDSGKAGRIYKASNHGLAIHGVTGTENDFAMFTPTGMLKIVVPTGTNNLILNRDNGNVGIGTSSPTEKLDVQGNVLINGAAPYLSIKTTQTGTPDWKIYNSYNSVGDLAIVGGSSVGNKFNIQPNGNVGIGTTSPGRKLQVEGGDFYTNDRSDTAGASVGYGGNSFQIRNGSTSEDLNFDIFNRTTSAWGTPLIIKNTGNVGIGTTSPSAKLDISNGTNSLLTLGEDSGRGVLRLYRNTASAYLQAWHDGTNGSISTTAGSIILSPSSGNVGIGTTSPNALLHLESASSPALQITDTTQPTTLRLYAQDSNTHIANITAHDMVFDTNNTERMRIDSAGAVGIGSTSPTSRLTVAVGDIETSGVGYGLILKSPNGTRYRVTVDNSGNLSTTAV